MIIENNGTDSCVLTIPVKIPRTIDSEKGFEVILETTWIGGDENKGFGLIIGRGERNCYKFTLSNNGYFSIFGWDYLKFFTLHNTNPVMLGWKKYDFINTGAGAKNVIRVLLLPVDSRVYGMFVVYVNDVMVTRNVYFLNSNSVYQFEKDGVIGVYSYGKQNVAFNKLTFAEWE